MTDTGFDRTDNWRAARAHLGPQTDTVELKFNGKAIAARRGESVLAALVAVGQLHLRTTQGDKPRGPFCGMGVCQDCLVEIDGLPAQRACMTRVDRPMSVRTQAHRVALVERPEEAGQSRAYLEPLTPQIAVIGAGPAGMSAALHAASLGADVLLIDERPQLGGQFYKQPLDASDLSVGEYDDRQFQGGRDRIRQIEQSAIKVMRGARVAGAYEPGDIVVITDTGPRLIRPQIMIVATGAYEFAPPIPGWTLPGVMTTGAAQSLLRNYRVLPGRRVVVAGNGPLNFQAAAELAQAGADIAAVIETARQPGRWSIRTMMAMMTSSPDLTLKGAGYLASLRRRRVPVIYGHGVSRIDITDTGNAQHLTVRLRDLSRGQTADHRFAIDAVCLGYGFRPSNEILRALGCRQEVDRDTSALVTVRDEHGRTTRDTVFAVGDCTRLGGARVAEAEGIIAANEAARALGVLLPAEQSQLVEQTRSLLFRHQQFQRALWTLFEPAGDVLQTIDSDAVLCRCEELSAMDVEPVVTGEGALSMANLKRSTRAGMGRCQGRYCGPVIASMIAQDRGQPIDEADLWAPRPPTKPVRIADLARLDLPHDAQ